MSVQNQTLPIPPAPRCPGWGRLLVLGRNWKFTLMRLAVLAAAVFIVFHFILLPIRVEGISMLPTYRNGSVNFVNRLAYIWHGPRRGDVVGVRYSREETNATSGIHRILNWLNPPHIMLVKRIIGLPGETVAFVNGRVLINGHVLNEPYVKKDCDWNQSPVKLGSNQYYVVGDNRSMPPRDHVHGVAERGQIIGKTIL